ncbi:MAG TPA: hypothetical protein VFF26_14750 [Gallionella sp.]|nr:hypothetical protein [Gallionella sp.]
MKIDMKEEIGMWLCVTVFSAIAIGMCVAVAIVGKTLELSGAGVLAFVFPCALVIAAVVVYGVRWWVENIESPNV